MKKLILFSVVTLLLFMNFGTLSAWDWDNVKSYDHNTKTATVTNGLGLGSTVAELTLDTPLNNKVGIGYQRVAEITIDNRGQYNNALNDMQFYNKKTGMTKFDRDFDYLYKTTETYEIEIPEEDCNNKLTNGSCGIKYVTQERERELWKSIGKDLPKGNVTIGIYTFVEQGDNVEWIPEWFGVEIEEWASWVASLDTALVSYWTFNETTGNWADGVESYDLTEVNSPEHLAGGKMDYASSFDGSGDYARYSGNIVEMTDNAGPGAYEVTMAGWANISDTPAADTVFGIGTDTSDNYLWLFGTRGTTEKAGMYSSMNGDLTIEETGASGADGEWHHFALTYNGTGFTLYVDGVRNISGNQDYPVFAPPNRLLFGAGERSSGIVDYGKIMADEWGFWNRTLTDSEISLLYNGGAGITLGQTGEPIVTIVYPTATTYNSITTMNYSFTGAGDRCWYSEDFGSTNSTPTVPAWTNFTGLTADEGSNTWTTYCNNTLGVGNSTVTFSLDTLSPIINISSPNGTVNYQQSGLNISLNWTMTEGNLDSCWYEYDGTNYSIVGTRCTITNFTSFNVTDSSKRSVKFFANDSLNNIGEVTSTWTYLVFENNVTYTSAVYEGSTESYVINLDYPESDYPTISAELIYNGTTYTSTDSGSGNNSIFTSSIDIPSTSVSTPYTFYWEISLNDGSTITMVNTSSYTQTVTPLTTLNISNADCVAGMFQAVNFTFSDANNLTNLSMDVNYNFQYGTGNSTLKRVYGSYTGINVLRLCINSTIQNYTIGYGEVDYERESYVERRFYLYDGTTLSNSTGREYVLHNLESSEATSFIFEIKNTFLNPYTGKYISLLRWYPDLDEYRITEMAQTDDNGKTVMKVKVEDIDYRLGVYDTDGSLIKLADPVRMACLVNPCTYTLKIVQDAEDYFEVLDVESSLTFDTTNSRFLYIFNDPGQITTQMRLEVYKDAGYQQILICNNSATGYTGVITCPIGNYTGAFHAVAYRSASAEKPMATLWYTLRDGISSDFGLFAAAIFGLAAALIGIFSPTAAIVMLGVGLVPALILGSINITIFMGIIVLGGIIIHYLRRV